MEKKIVSIILAAGQGKRMKNPDLPKVLCPLHGKPLIQYVLETVKELGTEKDVVIVGHQREKLIEFFSENYPSVETCVQDEQLGTGHAVAQAEELLKSYVGDFLILAGDVPLITSESLNKFYDLHMEASADVSVLSTMAENPFGYGRIVRNEAGMFKKIVEQKDANESEQAIKEINSGIYLVKSRLLFVALRYVSNTNEQKEYYLTDIVEILKNNGAIVRAFAAAEFEELQGVNSVDDLKRAEESYTRLGR